MKENVMLMDYKVGPWDKISNQMKEKWNNLLPMEFKGYFNAYLVEKLKRIKLRETKQNKTFSIL
jgi:hypothetical protein